MLFRSKESAACAKVICPQRMLLLDTVRSLVAAVLSGPRGEGKDVISAEQGLPRTTLGPTQAVMT
mgnify:FL=1